MKADTVSIWQASNARESEYTPTNSFQINCDSDGFNSGVQEDVDSVFDEMLGILESQRSLNTEVVTEDYNYEVSNLVLFSLTASGSYIVSVEVSETDEEGNVISNQEFLIMTLNAGSVEFRFSNTDLGLAAFCLASMHLCYKELFASEHKFSLMQNTSEEVGEESRDLLNLSRRITEAREELKKSNFVNHNNYLEGHTFIHSDRSINNQHIVFYAFDLEKYLELSANILNSEFGLAISKRLNASSIFTTRISDTELQINIFDKETKAPLAKLSCYKVDISIEQNPEQAKLVGCLDFAIRFDSEFNFSLISLNILSRVLAYKLAQLFRQRSS